MPMNHLGNDSTTDNEPSRSGPANGTQGSLPRRPGLSELTARISAPHPGDEEAAQRQQEAERRSRQAAREASLQAFLTSVGARYRNATFHTYVCRHPGQAEVLRGLHAYAANFPRHLAAGEGVLLFGPAGGGKDHLLVALARDVFPRFPGTIEQTPILWRNGLDVFGAMRDLIHSDGKESEFVTRLAAPAVLILSDPLPPVGAVTEFQATLLLRVIDARYRAFRPTWCTLNVADGDELAERIGPQVADRLKDGAIGAYCNWPSYRQPAKQLWTGGNA